MRTQVRPLSAVIVTVALSSFFFFVTGCKRSAVEMAEPSPEETQVATEEAAPQPEFARTVPPKTEWRAQASGLQDEIYPAHYACDGNFGTRWSSPDFDPQWIAFDLGQPTLLCGMIIYWETAYADQYEIQVSDDGRTWRTVYGTETGDGGSDVVFFEPSVARHVRIWGKRRATGWGYSIWEVELLGEEDRPTVHFGGEPVAEAADRLFDGKLDTVWLARTGAQNPLVVDLRQTWPLGAVRLDWGSRYATEFQLAVSEDNENWIVAQHITNGVGRFDVVFTPKIPVRFLKWQFVQAAENEEVEIAEMTIKREDESFSPLRLYQLAAQKAPRGHYPLHLLRQQTYWTIVGLPGDREESLFDEYGNLEPVRQGPSLMPFLMVGTNLLSAVDADSVRQELQNGYLPLPSVEWQKGSIRFKADAYTWGSVGEAVTAVRYTVLNEGTEPLEAKLFLTIRPIQINPPWQFGGLSSIRELRIEQQEAFTVAYLDGVPRFVTLTKPDIVGVRVFDGADIVADLARGYVPPVAAASHPEALVSGTLGYDIRIGAGESRSVVLCSPLGGDLQHVCAFMQVEGSEPGSVSDPDEAYILRRRAVSAMWDELLSRAAVRLPETAISEALAAQVAYIYLNQDGPAIQPGPRNYDRSWMRDGALTCAALLRMGHPEPVRQFVDWYAARVQPNGWVPPILNTDGSINQGFGWDNEYDSQGQFVFLIMDLYRFTRDRSVLERHFDVAMRALRYLQELRERTLSPDYRKDDPERERFGGILPPSISHEGYSPAMHSYWDNFWALCGWREGREIARILGDDEKARWCDEQYAALRDSLLASVRKTMEMKGIDFIPGCADKGDFDPTSTSIAFFPCEVAHELPAEALWATYERYWMDVHRRKQPGGWTGGYTPYEWRNVGALVEVGQPERAWALMEFLMQGMRPSGWRHWAEVVLQEYRMGSYIGDMPHTWVGAGFVTAIRSMLVKERSDGSLVLFDGAPRGWFEGEGIELHRLPTYYGPVSVSAQWDGKEMKVRLRGDYEVPAGILICWPVREKPQRVTVLGTEWSRFDERGCHISGRVTGEVVAQW